jgi:hypothetical protein
MQLFLYRYRFSPLSPNFFLIRKVAASKFEVYTALLFQQLVGLKASKPINHQNIPEDQYFESRN